MVRIVPLGYKLNNGRQRCVTGVSSDTHSQAPKGLHCCSHSAHRNFLSKQILSRIYSCDEPASLGSGIQTPHSCVLSDAKGRYVRCEWSLCVRMTVSLWIWSFRVNPCRLWAPMVWDYRGCWSWARPDQTLAQ